MSNPVIRRLVVVAVAIACLALAPAAMASTSATLTLDQSAGKTAGSAADLGLDLKFTNTGTDSPRDLTINLPPGLLANAAIDGGNCLRTSNVSGTTCEVGTGTVTATPDLVGILNVPLPVSVPVSFYLVPPPASGDLAGLAVMGLGEQLGGTGAIQIRPSGSPDGVGVTIALVLPDQLPLSLPGLPPLNLTQISLDEIKSTFDSLRYPTTCPQTPADLKVAVDSYADSTTHSVAAPLSVTGCAQLAYAPTFKATAARDSGDRQVKLDTAITQTPNQAPSRSISLTFPPATFAPNLGAVQALCVSPSSGTCQSVGAVTATSPLYPTPLLGKAYLTGSSSGLSLTLAFPPPFPLTLTGAVNLLTNSATFSELPDIPLTNLGVSLAGGPEGLFLTTCKTPSGTATATLTDQNGDKTVNAGSSFTVSGCPGTGGTPGASSAAGVTVGSTTLSKGGFSGLGTMHPTLHFTLRVARHAPKIRTLTVGLPQGLRFRSHVGDKRAGVALNGAKIKTLSLSHGRLTIVLRRAVSSLTVEFHGTLLTESRALEIRSKRVHSLTLTVITRNTRGQRTFIRVKVSSRRLA